MKTTRMILSLIGCLAFGGGLLSSHTASAETFNGYLDASTPCATHTVTLDEDGELDLALTRTSGELDMQYYQHLEPEWTDCTGFDHGGYAGIFLFDGAGVPLHGPMWGPSGPTDYNPITINWDNLELKAGTYTVLLVWLAEGGNYTLETAFTPQPLANDSEPDDDPASANPLTPNVSETGHLGYIGGGDGTTADIEDWWTISLPADGDFTVTLDVDPTLDTGQYGDPQGGIYIYDSDGSTLIGYWIGPRGQFVTTASTATIGLKAGTYFVRVVRFEGYGGYTITPTFVAQPLANDSEPDDDSVSANSLTANVDATGHLGYVGGGAGAIPDIQDWWQITFSGDGALTLTIEADPYLDLRNYSRPGDPLGGVYLYDADGATQIALWWGPGGGTATLPTVGLQAGTYYVRVVCNVHDLGDGGYGAYTLTPAFVAQPLAADTEPNDTFPDAVSAQPNSDVTGHLGYVGGGGGTAPDNQDWWSITMPAPGDLTLEIYADSTLDLRGYGDPTGGVYLYESDASTQIGYWWGPSGSTLQLETISLPAGEYFVRMVCVVHELGDEGYGAYTLSPRAVFFGDIDGLEAVTIADAIIAGKVLAGQVTAGLIRAGYPDSGADADDDGIITLKDMIYILQVVGLAR